MELGVNYSENPLHRTEVVPNSHADAGDRDSSLSSMQERVQQLELKLKDNTRKDVERFKENKPKMKRIELYLT